MHVVKISELQEEPMGRATPIAGWTGGAVSRSRQTIIPDGDSDNYRCSVVNFKQGATTGWHAHTCDQILVVTGGSGIVATEHEERTSTSATWCTSRLASVTGTVPKPIRRCRTLPLRRQVRKAAGRLS